MNDPAQATVLRLRIGLAAASLAIAALLASNVAAVTHAGYHDALFSALARAAATVSTSLATRLVERAPLARQARVVQAATAGLQKRLDAAEGDNARLRAANAELTSETRKLAKGVKTAEDLHRRALSRGAKIASSVQSRLVSTVRRGVGALAGEAIPVVGVALSVAVTAADVVQACQSMKELRELLDGATGGAADEERVCGARVPTQQQLLSALPVSWQPSWDATVNELRAYAGPSLSLPKAPSGAEVRAALCGLQALVRLC